MCKLPKCDKSAASRLHTGNRESVPNDRSTRRPIAWRLENLILISLRPLGVDMAADNLGHSRRGCSPGIILTEARTNNYGMLLAKGTSLISHAASTAFEAARHLADEGQATYDPHTPDAAGL
ncbi:hypothetical protein BST61_g8652 [Cercospora zeina]